MSFALLPLLISLTWSAYAGELAGITMPDSRAVGGQALVLNGMGLREKYFVDVYVGGLYLPSKSGDWEQVVQQDSPKCLFMHFVLSEVTRDKMIAVYEEGFADNPLKSSLQSEIATFLGWQEAMHAGEQMSLEYVPGAGTTVTIKGQKKGTIAGVDFMRLVFNNYLSPNANKAFRSGLLGQG